MTPNLRKILLLESSFVRNFVPQENGPKNGRTFFCYFSAVHYFQNRLRDRYDRDLRVLHSPSRNPCTITYSEYVDDSAFLPRVLHDMNSASRTPFSYKGSCSVSSLNNVFFAALHGKTPITSRIVLPSDEQHGYYVDKLENGLTGYCRF